MVARFEFATATRIVFGPGTLAEVGALARELGHRAVVVTGRDSRRAAPLLAQLQAAGMSASVFAVEHEPTIDDIVRGVAHARATQSEVVVGFGGGAALDSAKAIAALLTNPAELLDYLEVIGSAKPLARPAAPCIAIPTTAGTGSEVTRNAVLASPAHRVKVSLRSPHMLPRIAIVDPDLTLELPPGLTASTGLDALTQLIEPYVSGRANPLTDALCVDGIRRAARSLRTAVQSGRDRDARADMSLASLFGGLALANAGLGAVHGFAGPVGGMFPAPHGAVCAVFLPLVMATNLHALRTRAAGHDALRRYEDVARLLTGRSTAPAEDGVRWVEALVTELKIPSLAAYGVTTADFPAIVNAAARASSMKANPIPLSDEELSGVLQRAL